MSEVQYSWKKYLRLNPVGDSLTFTNTVATSSNQEEFLLIIMLRYLTDYLLSVRLSFVVKNWEQNAGDT